MLATLLSMPLGALALLTAKVALLTAIDAAAVSTMVWSARKIRLLRRLDRSRGRRARLEDMARHGAYIRRLEGRR